MDFPVQRRAGAIKYGKKSSKSLGVNFFNTEKPTVDASTRYPISPSSPGTRDAEGGKMVEEPASPSRRNSVISMPAHVTAHSPAPRSLSPVKRFCREEQVKQSTFQVNMSDLEPSDSDRPMKRRKVSKLQVKAKDSQMKGKQDLTTEKRRAHNHSDNDVQSKTEKRSTKSSMNAMQRLVRQSETAEVDIPRKDVVKPSKPPQKAPGKLARKVNQDSQIPSNMADTKMSSENLIVDATREEISDSAVSRYVAPKAPKQLKKKPRPVTNQLHRQSSNHVSDATEMSSRPKTTKIKTRIIDSTRVFNDSASTVQLASRKKTRARKPGHSDTRSALEVKSTNDLSKTSKTSDIYDMADSDEEMELQKTPRTRLRRAADSDSSVGSPSQLGLKDLRLTPIRRLSFSSASSAAATPPRRGRTRQIDMLDAPECVKSQTTSRSVSRPDRPTLAQRRSRVDATAPSLTAVPQLSRANSSQGKPGFAKPKVTYGSQRSHLAGMVDDLDIMSASSSQETSQKLISQLTSVSSRSQLDNELELNDTSSDDANVGGKLLSIHQLRQQGANNRFERDLELLLEDMDPISAANSTGTRILGSIKMFKRMTREPTFESYVTDHALERLTDWSKMTTDKCSRLVIDMILWRLVHSRNMTPKMLVTVVQAVRVSTATITDLITLAIAAQDPTEKLSKSMIKEMQTFEDFVIKNKLLPAYEGDRIVPAAISIAALNDSLRKLVESSTTPINMGSTALQGVVPLMKRASQITNNKLQSSYITKLTLSLLELLSSLSGSDLSLSDQSYSDLGDSLASIIKHTIDSDDDLTSHVLRFAFNLCKDRSDICINISRSDLPSSLVRIIDARLLKLVKAADASQTIDIVMLDSIIMSLACLLQITACDDSIRQQFADTTYGSATHLSVLVEIFDKGAPTLSQAETIEHSQVKVAFGYLSLLLCNLCVQNDVWNDVQNMLNANEMEDIIVWAKKLLIHLQRLEMELRNGSEDVSLLGETEAEADKFTQRFEQIICCCQERLI